MSLYFLNLEKMNSIRGLFLISVSLFSWNCTLGKDHFRTYTARVGSSFTLACTPNDAEEILHYFEWSKEGRNLPEKSWNDPRSKFRLLSNFSLLVQDVVEEDSGNYTCRIQSDPPRITNYYVQVEAPAKIEQYPPEEPLVAREGSNVSLLCLVTGRPTPEIVWTHQGRAVDPDKVRQSLNSNSSISSKLQLTAVERNQAGLYSCAAENGVNQRPVAGNFRLEVTYAPEIQIERAWIHAGLGSSAELVCLVYGQPAAHVSWYFNGSSPVYGSDRVGFQKNGNKYVLKIKNVWDTDLGVYSCRAHSNLGQAEAALELSGLADQASLKVEPPRDGPKNEEEETIYRLIWTTVSHSPLQEYRLKIREVSKSHTDSEWKSIIIPALASGSSAYLHSQQYKLKGLVPGKSYQVAVQSRNRFGWSQDSNVVTINTGDGDSEVDISLEDENEFIQVSDNFSPVTSTTTARVTTTTAKGDEHLEVEEDSASSTTSTTTIETSSPSTYFTTAEITTIQASMSTRVFVVKEEEVLFSSVEASGDSVLEEFPSSAVAVSTDPTLLSTTYQTTGETSGTNGEDDLAHVFSTPGSSLNENNVEISEQPLPALVSHGEVPSAKACAKALLILIGCLFLM